MFYKNINVKNRIEIKNDIRRKNCWQALFKNLYKQYPFNLELNPSPEAAT